MLENPPADRPAAVSGLKLVVAPTEVTLMMESMRYFRALEKPEGIYAQGTSTREGGDECVTRVIQARARDPAVSGGIENGGSASS